jgi:hypothetical protein
MSFGSVSWNSPWDARKEQQARYSAAEDFLRTGNWNLPRECFDSKQCGSGFACVGGECKKTTDTSAVAGECAGASSTSTGMSPSGCGSSSGGSVGCTTSGCSNDADCPGSRCCRYDAYGTVNCFCGDCPIYDGNSCSRDCQCYSGVCRNGICGEGYCTIFCDQYYKSTGQRFPGCEGATCDECSSCQGDNQCHENTYGPCWCTGCPVGEVCDNGAYGNLGTCIPAPAVLLCKDQRACGKLTGKKCCKQPYQWLENPEDCGDGTYVDGACKEDCRAELYYFSEEEQVDIETWNPPCGAGCYCTVVNWIYEEGEEQFSLGQLIGAVIEKCCAVGGGGPDNDCTDKQQTVPGTDPSTFEIPCPPECTCTGLGFITAADQTTHFWKECCGKECDCEKNPETCNDQCGTCKQCSNGRCISVANCPPTEPPDSLDNDTCFVGFYGYGCFTNVTAYDNDCCYFQPTYRPDGGWSGTYIGGGTVKVTSCTGAFCGSHPVGSTHPIPTMPVILSNSTGSLGSALFCCNPGNLVGVTYS